MAAFGGNGSCIARMTGNRKHAISVDWPSFYQVGAKSLCFQCYLLLPVASCLCTLNESTLKRSRQGDSAPICFLRTTGNYQVRRLQRTKGKVYR